MKRTQLNLDEKTYYQLVSYARREKISLSEAARTLIKKQAGSQDNPLLGQVQLGKKLKIELPEDASENHDYYLYGEGSPKFGKKV